MMATGRQNPPSFAGLLDPPPNIREIWPWLQRHLVWLPNADLKVARRCMLLLLEPGLLHLAAMPSELMLPLTLAPRISVRKPFIILNA